MDNSSKKSNNYQLKSKIWQWIAIFAVILSLISGSVLLYQWWKTKQREIKVQELEKQLEQAEEKQAQAIQQYQNQQKQLLQVLILAKNPAIHHFFNDLLGGYAYRFAEKKNLTNYCLPLTFGGFYQKPIPDGEKQGEMGNCCLEKEKVIISLNQVYLFNKLGHECYFSTPESYLDISFAGLIETISHELAHYFQFSKYKQSSCESSGAKNINGEFVYPKLVSEHIQFTKEIKEMIINSAEYSVLEKYWKEITALNASKNQKFKPS